MEKFCKSCGMPMDNPEDFANNNQDSHYCYYCGEKEAYSKEEIYEKNMEKEEYYKKKAKKKKLKK
ncbi:hypothetical protein J4446_02075 [Candidatus Woesearchaeota archaeon]|nr:hypothetical protein [Candidatus Woesearchaeota archaeon]